MYTCTHRRIYGSPFLSRRACTTTPTTTAEEVGSIMYTTIHIPRDTNSDSLFFQGVREACERHSKAGARSPYTHYAGIDVRYGAWGIACQFGQRLLDIPAEFKDLDIGHVSMKARGQHHSVSSTGVYKRKRATAVVERFKDHSWNADIEAETLAAANRLLDDVVSGKAQPTKAYDK